MKKIVTVVLLLMIICSLFAAFRITANATTSGDFEYYINYDGKVVISRYIGSGGDVVVPSVIDGQPVFALGGETFRYNDGAINVTISEGIEQIYECAFYSAGDVESVSIPSSVTIIEPCPFMACQKLKQITVNASNINYISIDGVLFTKDMTHIIQYPISLLGDVYVIPDGVRYIDKWAFRGCKLRQVSIPNSVREIGYGAFSESWIVELDIPNGITKIGDHAFTYLNNLVSVNISKSVSSIGQKAFRYCTNLPNFHVDDANSSYKSVEGIIFNKNMTELLYYPQGNSRTEYEIPSTVNRIAEAALDGARNLRKITIPDSVTSIGSSAFHWCFGLEDFIVSEQNQNYSSVDGVLFNKDMSCIILYPPNRKNKLYSIPDNVSVIEKRAFTACHNLTHVILSNNITEISASAFNSCSNLSDIVIPNSVEVIESCAFQNCGQLNSIVIPSSVTNIHSLAFEQCSNLEKVYFMGDAPTLYLSVFEECPEDLTIYYSKDASGYTNPWYDYTTIELDANEMPELNVQDFGNVDGFTYWIRNGESTIVDYTGNETSVVIPSLINGYPVSKICTIAFRSNSNITNVIIPNGTREIGASAFSHCIELRQVLIPDSVNLIGEYAFSDCVLLQNIVLPVGLKEINKGVFTECNSLVSAEIPEGVTTIHEFAFGHCRLTSVTIPSSVNKIEPASFLGCVMLSSVFFKGDAPHVDVDPSKSQPFDYCANELIIYYQKGVTGFTNPWHGLPTIEYDPDELIRSSVYSINRPKGWIQDVPIFTSVLRLKTNLENCKTSLKVFDTFGSEYTGNSVGTGMSVKLIIGGRIRDQLKTIVSGDLNGDGAISITDYTLARLDILDLKTLTDEFRKASDINSDGKISITDYTLIRLDILGLKSIH